MPELTPKEREDQACREHGAVFIIGIGNPLPGSGEPHDGRAPDYDDWTTETAPGYHGLNGDLLVWNPVLGRAVELSSMGIRVNAEILMRQLEKSGEQHRAKMYFHQELLAGRLPLTMGGGIGQSRLCMLMMGCAHIGEVQSSIWDAETHRACEAAGIRLL